MKEEYVVFFTVTTSGHRFRTSTRLLALSKQDAKDIINNEDAENYVTAVIGPINT